MQKSINFKESVKIALTLTTIPYFNGIDLFIHEIDTF